MKGGGYIKNKSLGKEKIVVLSLISLLFLFIFSFAPTLASSGNKVIVINPGHSVGYDSGATNSSTGVTEAQVNQDLAGVLAQKLEKAGYTVYITHTSDNTYSKYRLGSQSDGNSLKTSCNLANAKNPDLVLSLHHNSGGNSSGYELYWSSYRDFDTNGVYEVSGLWSDGSSAYRDSSPCEAAQNSKILAEKIQTAFSGSKLAYRKTVERDDYFPAHSTAACVLYEGGFISNNSESQYLNSSTYREDASNRLLSAVNSYFGSVSSSSSSLSIGGIKTSFTGSTTTDAVIKFTATGVTGASKVLFPIWSTTNGQDDLKWYVGKNDGNGNWSVTIDLKNHNNDLGQYACHVYAYDSKNNSVKSAITFNVALPDNVSDGFSIQKISEDEANVYLKGYDGNTFNIAAWSAYKGQDDLVWYQTVRQTDNSYKATIKRSNHNNDDGTYWIDAYYPSNYCIGRSSVTFASLSAQTLSVSEAKDSQFTINLSNITAPNGVKNIMFAVWTSKNGQDDLKWYTATKTEDGNYTCTINLKKHNSEEGTYLIDAYGTNNYGKQDFLIRSTTTINPMSASEIVASSVSNASFTITVSGVKSSYGVSKIMVPVWSINNGQDDLVWYTAQKSGDNYVATIDLKKHNYDTGQYAVHVYGTDNNKKQQFLGKTTVSVDTMSLSSIDVSEVSNGRFTITLNGVSAPNGLKNLLIPVWSATNGQDDIKWYTAQKSGDSYTVTVSIADHKNDSGTYYIHVYGTDSRGTQNFLGATQTTVPTMTASSLSAVDNGDGTFTINVSGLTAPNGVKEILLPTWSSANGQDDIKWYVAIKSGDTYTATVNIKDHKNEYGEYTIHAYGTDNTGKQVFLNNTQITLKAPATNAVTPESSSFTPVDANTAIMGTSQVTVDQLINLYTANAGISFPDYYVQRGVTLQQFCQMYIDEANTEGVRAEIAFAQAMHETGWLKFGGDVKISQFNFAGLGATGNGVTGEDFAAAYGDNATGIRMGIRAQIQHLKAYASTDNLVNACVDNRFKYVSPRGKAATIGQLTGTWAADQSYATKLIAIINKIQN